MPRPSDTSAVYIDARAGTYSGLQSDTVAAGLLQRCVVRCSSRQYSEAATHAEHCGVDRSSGAKEVTCSVAPGTAAFAASPPADRLQAGRSNTRYVPHPHHPISAIISHLGKPHVNSVHPPCHYFTDRLLEHISPTALSNVVHPLSGTRWTLKHYTVALLYTTQYNEGI